jgi:hypothetical protein
MSKELAIPELSDAEKQRFWDKVEKRQDGCWVWAGKTYSNSNRKLLYGQFRIGAHRYAAHRVSWRISHGPIPAGLQCDHKCHNTMCVNPAHLHVVTQQENSENRLGPSSSKSDCPHSGFRGVTWDKSRHEWRVSVKHLGRSYNGGRYADMNEANHAAIALRNRLMSNNLEDR